MCGQLRHERGGCTRENTYLFVLGLLKSRLVVLGTSTHKLLLDEVDACHRVSYIAQRQHDGEVNSPLSR
jgi:hypothetical protein